MDADVSCFEHLNSSRRFFGEFGVADQSDAGCCEVAQRVFSKIEIDVGGQDRDAPFAAGQLELVRAVRAVFARFVDRHGKLIEYLAVLRHRRI